MLDKEIIIQQVIPDRMIWYACLIFTYDPACPGKLTKIWVTDTSRIPGLMQFSVYYGLAGLEQAVIERS